MTAAAGRVSKLVDDAPYLHGTTPAEQDRLSRLNELLNEAALRELKLRGGERILDVGCGLAQLTRAFSRQAGCAAVGIERSSEQLRQARQLAEAAGETALVDLRQGSAESLPLRDDEWGTFDIVHTRFVLEHVPDPAAVVRQMVRSARPGGRIILADDTHDTHRLWPEPPGLSRLWQSYLRTYDRLGNDPYVGHRLVSLLVEAGAKPVRNTWLFFGACSGQSELLAAYVDNLARILAGAAAQILALGEFDRPALDTCLAALRAWGQRPDAAYWYAIAWAEGTK
jgi:ubiquinone/menaquinone biosynthesis C-methylase UbiE